MDSVDEYVNNFEGVKKEWLTIFITFMHENFPDIKETISYQMPTFKFNGTYIAFSIAKDHFSFHSIDFEMIDELKKLLPNAKFGRGCAKVKFEDRASIPVLFNTCKKIVQRNYEIVKK
jgi:uncharacterized protein YdhG (YjbR/CyaY superfamily)